MAQNLDPKTTYEFITHDFESAWRALVRLPDNAVTGRGNFMFGWLAMTLLEWAARLCVNDKSGGALRDVSTALGSIDPKYFTLLPGPCARPKDFDLPYETANGQAEAQLLWALYDMIRHGQAHQYQQILVGLNDSKDLHTQLVGAAYGCPEIDAVVGRPPEHLGYHVEPNGDVLVKVHPDWLFRDFRAAIETAGLLGRGLTFVHLTRGATPTPPTTPTKQLSKGTKRYDFSSTQLTAFLSKAGHGTW